MSTTVIMVIAALGFFLAMGLMRWTLRQSRRDYQGIQWRGIDWSRGREDKEAPRRQEGDGPTDSDVSG
jgi:hypothetical protein